LRYVGAVLVRSETDYHVVSLPDRVGIIVGGLTGQDCQDFAEAIRAEKINSRDNRIGVHCLVKDDVLQEPAKLSDKINGFKADPIEFVRAVGSEVFLQTCSDRYRLLGQYKNAINTLHQAILLDSKNARNYNSFAWIKATCPDVSVRNGKEAVSAATHACELTQWKNSTFIDTLAAACAEAGDFKRAVEFQEQALRTGHPTDSEKKAMRERAALYQRAEPFRENSLKP
jgi:tetratricopeptide (TPR) repeat protein